MESKRVRFAAATGATPIAGRSTLGTFTNQIQAAFREPRLLVVTDPRADHQPLTEASYVNLPTIALCNTDSPLRYVDIAIRCNNKGAHSVGLMWMLAWEVLRMRGTVSREHPWEVMPDLYFYRDPEEIDKEEQAAAEKAVTKEEFQGEWTAPAPEFTAAQPEVADWSEGVQVPSVPIQQCPTEDWSAQPPTEGSHCPGHGMGRNHHRVVDAAMSAAGLSAATDYHRDKKTQSSPLISSTHTVKLFTGNWSTEELVASLNTENELEQADKESENTARAQHEENIEIGTDSSDIEEILSITPKTTTMKRKPDEVPRSFTVQPFKMLKPSETPFSSDKAGDWGLNFDFVFILKVNQPTEEPLQCKCKILSRKEIWCQAKAYDSSVGFQVPLCTLTLKMLICFLEVSLNGAPFRQENLPHFKQLAPDSRGCHLRGAPSFGGFSETSCGFSHTLQDESVER
ncbi:hypothetical protein JEQ12_010622 [Ovis aries]|uniref:40S ribosomal protein SA n=1 Tax=Ovis aries TaxID=9940 RepID=A0A836CTQ2_SHEEP|nr:hypothetical protein JEQ12_010622 [Ovis aries]